MHFKQFYLGCLAHASYLVGSRGEAAVVDPQRDVDLYLEEAAEHALAIKWIVETHLHADFVSGHVELARRTGATIVFGEKADASFPHRKVKDGDEIHVGRATLRFLETPGHTPESISILVVDTEAPEKPARVLTGDTLFIGDVGRPDLAGGSGFTPETMAGLLYDSLHGKLLTLPDDVEVYPAHGAGSMCGKNISKETSSTIGAQRRFNYALQPMPRDTFVRMMTTDLPEAPKYFARDAALNRAGVPLLRELPRPEPLGPRAVRERMESGAAVLDVRPAAAFGAGHVPGSINIGLGGQFASWAGSLIPPGTPLVLVTENPAQVDEAVLRLSRVGIESVVGFLADGMYAWDREGLPTGRVLQIAVDELDRMRKQTPGLQIVDVRRPPEFKDGHAAGAAPAPLDRLREIAASLDPRRPTAVICQSGYRSSTATSLLQPLGFETLYNVVGGTAAWKSAGLPVENA